MFDPYHKWLGIKPGQRPPTHYQLLGIEPDEQDPEVIEEAAVRQTTHLRAYQIGAHADDCTRLLNEISQARNVLLNPAKRKTYDAALARNPARKGAVAPAELAHALQSGRPAPPAFAFTVEPEPFVAPLTGRNGSRSSRSQTAGRRSSLALWLGLGGGALVAMLGLVIVVLMFRKTPEPSAVVAPARDPLPPVVKKGTAEPAPVGPKKIVGDPPAQAVVPPPFRPVEPAPFRPMDPPLPPVAATATQAKVLREVRRLEDSQGGGGLVSFSPDGRRVFATSPMGLTLWDTASGKRLGSAQRTEFFPMQCARWLPDGRHLLIGSGGVVSDGRGHSAPRNQTLRIVDTETWQVKQQFPELPSPANCVALSPDGRLVAIGGGHRQTNLPGGMDCTIRLWELQSAKLVHTLQGHQARITALAFSPDGRRLLSCGLYTGLHEWDVQTGQAIVEVDRSRVSLGVHAAFGPGNRQLLASLGLQKTVNLLNVATGQVLFRYGPFGGEVHSLAISPDGRRGLVGTGSYKYENGRTAIVNGQAVVFDCAVRLLDLETGGVLDTVNATTFVSAAAFSPDGRLAASASRDTGITLWDMTAAANVAAPAPPRQDPPVPVTPGPARQLVADWNPAGRLAFSADGRRVLLGAQDATVRLHDVATGAELRRFVGHTQSALAVAFAPDGAHALSGGGDNTLRLWEVETGRQVRLFQGHTAPVTAVVFAPDGRSALSASQDHTVRLWNVETGQELHRFEGHTGPVTALTLSRDGQFAASGSEDKVAITWNVAKRREAGRIRTNGIQYSISDLELFPEAERLLCCSGFNAALVWTFKVKGTQSAQQLRGHTDKVVTGSLSGDGHLALTGSYDRTARLWDVASGRELCRLEGHAAPVTRVALSPDGRYALTGSGDQIVRLWELARRP